MRYYPSELVYKYLYQSSDLHDSEQYRSALRARVVGDQMCCESCGISFPTSHVRSQAETHKISVPKLVVDGEVKSTTEIRDEGAGLFALTHRDGNHENFDDTNLSLVCFVCHLSDHVSLGGMVTDGDLLLCGNLSQVELLRLWRLVQIEPMGGAPSPLRQVFDRIVAEGSKAFLSAGDNNPSSAPANVNETRAKAGAVTTLNSANALAPTPEVKDAVVTAPSPRSLRQWLAKAPPENVRRFVKMMPDLRFVPNGPQTALFVDAVREHAL